MKRACLILVIAGCALIQGTAYASASDGALQQSPDDPTTASSDHPNDVEHTVPASEGNPRKNATTSNERVASRDVSHRIHPRSHASPIKTNRLQQPRNSRGRSTPENLMDVRKPSLTELGGGVAKITNNRTLSVRPATGSAIDGQHLNHSRNRPGTTPVIGGPANATTNTVAINGNTVTRKHAN